MKTLITLLALGMTMTVNASEADLRGPYDAKMDKFLVTVKKNQSATLTVGKESHFSCWKKYLYTTLKEGNKIVVVRDALMHPMVVCDWPVNITEGTEVKIEAKNQTQYFELYAPSAAEVLVD